MSHVACVGLAVLDVVFTVDLLPLRADKYHASGVRMVGGGPAASGAVTIARMGGQAMFVGAVGDDLAGQWILDDLKSDGVDIAHVATVPNMSSPISAVTVDAKGERLIVNHVDESLFASITRDATPFLDARAVLADLRWPSGAETALSAAASKRIPGLLDYDSTPAIDDIGLLEVASHVVFAAPALAARAGVTDPASGLERLAAETNAWLAVTAGGDGVYWLDGHDVRHLAAFDVDVVDTLGAGDVFHGAFALALARGDEECDALVLANAAAAIKCTRPGGRAGIPDEATVRRFLQKRG